MNKIIKNIGLLALMMYSASSQSMTVWLVESGQDPFSNSQATLNLSAGTTSLDLFYDVEGDTSFGYDFSLDVNGTGSFANVGGGDSDLGNTTITGWQQLGGSLLGETGNSVLGFSFDFTADAGTLLSISGVYTDANFLEAPITSSTLATVVPLPAAVWLFLGGLGLISFTAKKKKNFS